MKQHGYIKSLDGVRALAIILVMAFHAGIIRFGWIGVQMFFVLSGFLITGILWKEKFRDIPLSEKLKNFWARRSLRIFPLYFGYLLVIGMIYLFTHFPVYFPGSAPYLFTYTYNYTRLLPGWYGNPLFTHLWSLSIEEQFYFFYPFVVFFLPARFVKWFLVTCVLLCPLFRFLLNEYYLESASPFDAADAVYWNTLSHLDAFFLGGLIPVMSLHTNIKRPGFWLLLSFALVMIAGVISYITSGSTTFFLADLGYDHIQTGYEAPVWRYTVLDLFFACLILYLISSMSAAMSGLRAIFSHSWMVSIGRVSYGMYIFHWAVYVYLFKRLNATDNQWLNTLMFLPYVAVVYLLAAASFRLYESRFLLLKDRFFPSRHGPSAPPPESVGDLKAGLNTNKEK